MHLAQVMLITLGVRRGGQGGKLTSPRWFEKNRLFLNTNLCYVCIKKADYYKKYRENMSNGNGCNFRYFLYSSIKLYSPIRDTYYAIKFHLFVFIDFRGR